MAGTRPPPPGRAKHRPDHALAAPGQRLAALPPRRKHLPLHRRPPAPARSGRAGLAPDRHGLRRLRLLHGPLPAARRAPLRRRGATHPRDDRSGGGDDAEEGGAKVTRLIDLTTLTALIIQVTL